MGKWTFLLEFRKSRDAKGDVFHRPNFQTPIPIFVHLWPKLAVCKPDTPDDYGSATDQRIYNDKLKSNQIKNRQNQFNKFSLDESCVGGKGHCCKTTILKKEIVKKTDRENKAEHEVYRHQRNLQGKWHTYRKDRLSWISEWV